MEKIFNSLKKKMKILSFLSIIFLIVLVNIVRVNADYMDEETVGNRKERQLLDKIDAIKKAFPNQIDKEALYATLAHRGTFTDYVNESYEENFNETEYQNELDSLAEQISVLGDNIIDNIASIGDMLSAAAECFIEPEDEDQDGQWDSDCVLKKMIDKYVARVNDGTSGQFIDVDTIKTPQSIDLLMAATIVMLDSSGWTGNYSDENYQKALAGNKMVGNMFDEKSPLENAMSIVMNGVFCAVGQTFDMTVSFFNPGFEFENGSFGVQANAMAGKLSRFYTMNNICNRGFIGGTYNHVKNPDLSTDEGKELYQRKKDVVAKQIINLAKYYRGDDAEIGAVCVTGNTQASDLSDMTPALCAEKFGPIAQAEYSRSGIFASVTLAQAWLEANCGKYTPPNSNNVFGIKCGNWDGECSVAGTSEFESGGYVNISAGFRVYPSVEEGFIDHTNVLLQQFYLDCGVLEATNYTEQIQAIKRCNYATDPNYVSKIVSIIEENGFDKWDVKVNTTTSNDVCAPIGNNGWTIRSIAPTKSDSAFVQSTEAANNTGQCVWYARGRAIEITEELRDNGKLSAEEASKIVNLLKRAYGNGGDIYDNAKSVFNGSSDIRKPKAGSYIVWKKSGSWGHVGIVEDVTDSTITLTEGWSTGGGSLSCNSDWSCVHFEGPTTYDLEDFYNNYGAHRDGSYSFSGYVYFLEPLN